MLLGEVGNPRTGKTLMNFKIMKNIGDVNPTIKLYANYPCFNPDIKYKELINQYRTRVKYIDPAMLLRLRLEREHEGLVNIDELWKWLQARGSGGAEINKVIGIIVFEHGKRGFDINWNSQLSSSIDKWVRLLTPRFFFSKTPSSKYFRYGYVSETYHMGKKVIRLKLSKANAELNYYPYFNTMYSPEWATEENTPTLKQLKEANTNTLNDLSQEEHEEVPPEVEKKDEETIQDYLEGNEQIQKELMGKKIIQFDEIDGQLQEVKKDVIEGGEKLE